MSEDTMRAPELANIDVEGFTRESFLVKGAVAAGAVYGVSSVAPFVSQALAQGGSGDLGVLNFALTLEYLEDAFYTMALSKVSLGGDAKKVATTIQKDEAEHVKALTATIKKLGGKPVAAPGVDFGKAFASEKSFLATAQTFEDLGVGAYNGAGPSIKSKDVLAAAGSIVQVEGRHAGVIRLMNGARIAPSAFDKGVPKAQVLAKAKPFIKS